MQQPQYHLTFRGRTAPGASRDQVIAGLARLFKRPPGDVAPLFSGEARVLKAAADAASLEPIRAAMAGVGALADIEAIARAPAPARAPRNATHGPEREAGGSAAPARADDEATPATPARSLRQFLAQSRERDAGQGLFELEGDRILEVNLEGEVWIKTGAMVAYTGDITFEREGLLENGLGKLVKKTVTGEGARLTRANGIGTLYLADSGKKIALIQLDGEPITVNGNDILAFERSIDWDVTVLRKMSAMLTGGLFNVRLQGLGLVAISTHHDPLTLDVRHAYPVYTDPHATVAWSASLEPTLKTDVSLKTFMGRASGESIQMCFEGEGFVVVQPMEERTFQR